MSKKRKTPGFDEVERSVPDELFDALYKAGCSSMFHKAMIIFNKPFNLKQVLDGLDSRLLDLREAFAEGTTFGLVEGYIHFDDVVAMCELARSSAMRRYHSLEEDAKRELNECKYHPDCQCRMIEQNIGFLLYLSWIESSSKEEEEEGSIVVPVSEDAIEEATEDMMDLDDIHSEMEADEERALIERFNTAIFRADTITKVESEDSVGLQEGDDIDTLECLPLFPTYCFNDMEYVLLNDIQHLFDLREDFALAILANWGEFDDGFVDSGPCPLAILDTEGDNFIEKEEASLLCIQMIDEFEKFGLPNDEEFKHLQETLGISDMGLEGQSSKSALSHMDETKSSIDLYNDIIFDMDETPQVN